jgi:hypothetical protein
VGFENLASLFDHNNLWSNTLMCESISCVYTIGLTNRKKRDELRSAFDFDEVRFFSSFKLLCGTHQ